MNVIESIYSERKKHLKIFLKDSVVKNSKHADYIGDLLLENICVDIFNDDKLCKHHHLLKLNYFIISHNN